VDSVNCTVLLWTTFFICDVVVCLSNLDEESQLRRLAAQEEEEPRKEPLSWWVTFLLRPFLCFLNPTKGASVLLINHLRDDIRSNSILILQLT